MELREQDERIVEDLRREFQKSCKSLLKELRQLRLEIGLSAPDAEMFAERDARRRAALGAHGVEILPLPEINAGHLIEAASRRWPPFDGNGAGVKDYVVWRSIVAAARPHRRLVFVNNDNDYLQDDQLHPQLLGALQEGVVVEAVKDLAAAAAILVPHDEGEVKRLAGRLTDGTFRGNLVRALGNAVIESRLFDHGSSSIATAVDPNSVEVSDVAISVAFGPAYEGGPRTIIIGGQVSADVTTSIASWPSPTQYGNNRAAMQADVMDLLEAQGTRHVAGRGRFSAILDDRISPDTLREVTLEAFVMAPPPASGPEDEGR